MGRCGRETVLQRSLLTANTFADTQNLTTFVSGFVEGEFVYGMTTLSRQLDPSPAAKAVT